MDQLEIVTKIAKFNRIFEKKKKTEIFSKNKKYEENDILCEIQYLIHISG